MKISRNDPCPCGSGKKFKKCCHAKALEEKKFSVVFQQKRSREKPVDYPVGTLASYGPDDRHTTKIVAGAILHEGATAILERWVATDVSTNEKVQSEIQAFFKKHGVKSVVSSNGNMGCPHEEGEDFSHGADCPFCPFWAGKQGSNRKD